MIKPYETEEDFDFENRILATSYAETPNVYLEKHVFCIKDIGLPKSIEKKLYGYITYIKNTNRYTNLLLIGCPQKCLSQILSALANEATTNFRMIEDRFLKQSDIAAILTNLIDGDFVCFPHISNYNSDIIDIIKKSMSTQQIDVTIGKGPSARKICIDLPSFHTLLAVENLAQTSRDMMDLFYDIIDFNKCDLELRKMSISDFAEKYNLHFATSVIEYLAKQFTNEDQLKIKLIDIRNQAFESNVFDITESFLQVESDSLPDIDEINTMDGREFELFTGKLFNAIGYTNVTVTQSSCDFGADVIAEKDDVKFAIQCKRYGSPVGVSAVQEVIASKSLHDCHVACILTNNTFTPAAEELARKNLVILWGGNKLKEFIDRAKEKQ